MTNDSQPKKIQLYPSFYKFNKRQSESIYVNELENSIDSLETGLTFFSRDDTWKWKWIAISLHHALYCFSVSCLGRSNYEYVLAHSRDEDDNRYCRFGEDDNWKRSKRIFRPDSPAYTICWEETDEDPTLHKAGKSTKTRPKRLISFWTALARVQDSYFWMGRSVVSKALKLTEDEWRSIEWLTLEARNQMVHFVPVSKSYRVEQFKRACLDVTRAIEFLALQSNTIIYTFRTESKGRIVNAIASLEKELCS